MLRDHCVSQSRHQLTWRVGTAGRWVADLPAIQSLIQNCHISEIEVRDANDIDVRQYTHQKDITPIKVRRSGHDAGRAWRWSR